MQQTVCMCILNRMILVIVLMSNVLSLKLRLSMHFVNIRYSMCYEFGMVWDGFVSLCQTNVVFNHTIRIDMKLRAQARDLFACL